MPAQPDVCDCLFCRGKRWMHPGGVMADSTITTRPFQGTNPSFTHEAVYTSTPDVDGPCPEDARTHTRNTVVRSIMTTSVCLHDEKKHFADNGLISAEAIDWCPACGAICVYAGAHVPIEDRTWQMPMSPFVNPSWDTVCAQVFGVHRDRFGYVLCACGSILQTQEGVREHWQLGHWRSFV